jgi:hypothetical protein
VLNLLTLAYISSTQKIEATRSSKTPVFTRPTRRHIPNDGILYVKSDLECLTNRTSADNVAFPVTLRLRF